MPGLRLTASVVSLYCEHLGALHLTLLSKSKSDRLEIKKLNVLESVEVSCQKKLSVAKYPLNVQGTVCVLLYTTSRTFDFCKVLNQKYCYCMKKCQAIVYIQLYVHFKCVSWTV